MTSKEFVIWLKGFTEGVHEFNVTPKQWDYLKEKLEQVSDEERIGTPIGIGGFGKVNVTPGTTGILNIPNLNTSTTYMNPQSGSWHYTNS